MSPVPEDRLQDRNEAPVRPERAFVLYWMIAARRSRWNFGLQRSIEWARELGLPLVILEPLRAGYRWSSERHHRFLIEGMRDNQSAFASKPVTYHPYVEPVAGEGQGLLEALAAKAAVVVTDESPMFFLPRMIDAAARKLDVRLESVDGVGILPLRAPDKTFARAYDFRRYLHKNLVPHLGAGPSRDPLARKELPTPIELDRDVLKRWPAADLEALLKPGGLDDIDFECSVPPVDFEGGSRSGERTLKAFLGGCLNTYADARGQVDVSSRLSSHLHFGHVGSHQVFDVVARHAKWKPHQINTAFHGKNMGWWNASPDVDAFLDQLVTWRELGAQSAFGNGKFGTYAGLPDWARRTLAEHANDPRPHVYDLMAFDRAATHDDIWNAAQRQLRVEGRIENYLRMLWGKKILHWSASPEEGFAIALELNQRYAIDGRDPNSDSGIGWVFGLFDRAWGPEREVFGKIRYMTSDSTRRKLRLKPYLERFGPNRSLFEG